MKYFISVRDETDSKMFLSAVVPTVSNELLDKIWSDCLKVMLAEAEPNIVDGDVIGFHVRIQGVRY